MKWANILRRWTIRSIHASILGAALIGSAGVTLAQTPGMTANISPKHYTRSLTFDLPVRMEPELRATLKEIRLYVKTPTSGWAVQDVGPASLEKFSCKLPQDGEYWYTLATVDKMGRMTPADVNLEPPSQRVVVDTAPPVIQVQPVNADGEYCLRCTVVDANPDVASLKAVCRTNAGDVPLDMVPNQPGVFQVKGPQMMQFPVIVSARDLAGNTATKEVNVREMVGTTFTPPQPPPPLANDVARTSVRPETKGLVGTSVDMPPAKTLEFPAPPPPPPPVTQSVSNSLAPTQPMIPSKPIEQPPVKPIEQPPVKPMQQPVEAPIKNGLPHQLISTTHASIEYRIDQVGPSGVGKVEVYMTPDNGQSWHRLGEDGDKRSPADINLPGDGVFGIRIVVTNGNGFGGKAPVRGDAPHCTVEVDTTSPFVQFRSADLMPTTGQVELRWNATDKNLGFDPVTLLYRTRPDGPWQVIARNLKNDGVYRWAFPREAGGQFFFKVEVTDQAGNTSHDVSHQPVVIDTSEPRATVLGVTGSNLPRPK